ncbi:MAG: hypothetical protein LBL19_07250 [Spirochaetaceae bacterium]|nr:hypothetical protein [Spirochaetaceae bacterium]
MRKIPVLRYRWYKGWMRVFLFIQAALLFLLFLGPLPAAAENVQVLPASSAIPVLNTGAGELYRLFPSLYYVDALKSRQREENFKPYWVASETEIVVEPQAVRSDESILLNEDILAFYGHPLSERMGILGRYSIGELDARLSELAGEYLEVNGGRGVRKAFYLIYGTVWPEGEIGILRESVLMEYIEYALEKDLLVFIDHQIGRYDPIDSLKRMLPYLKYPNVHLALDPEWRTTRPMMEIGTVTAAEINEAQRVMEEYLREQNLGGERLLVIHQFNWRMIQNREEVKSDFERVRLVHCADGFGSPSLKRASYAYNAQAANIPIKGFKLFYNFGIPGAGYDQPLLTPKQVVELNPRPYIIMYQ